MRPKITTSSHISHSISYNEQKVEEQLAERLTAANMFKPLDRLSREDIFHRFDRRMKLNDRVRTSLHITLNFDPQDKLTNEQMQKIYRTLQMFLSLLKCDLYLGVVLATLSILINRNREDQIILSAVAVCFSVVMKRYRWCVLSITIDIDIGTAIGIINSRFI